MKKFYNEIDFKKSMLLIFFAVTLISNLTSNDIMLARYIHVFFLSILGCIFLNKNKILPLVFFPFFYLIFRRGDLLLNGGYLNEIDIAVGVFLIFLLLYIGFKVNKTITILGIFFLSYLYFGKFIASPIGHNGFSIKRIVSHMIYSSSGFFGTGAGVSMSYIFLFMIFGAFLKYAGLTDFIGNISMSLFSKTSGGSAKVAVISSAFMGMVNGSAVANVATTGTFTIPMMKNAGYKSDFAAAVEALSSTGGQFCPPIMGAAAFVMAEFLNVSYLEVVKSAIIPAILFYSGILFSVHYEAKKNNIKNTIVNIDWKKELRDNFHLLIPIFLLIFLIYMGFPITKSVIFSTFMTYIVSLFRKNTRMTLSDLINAIYEGAMQSINIGICCVMIGLIIGTESLTGLGVSVVGYISYGAVRSVIFSSIIIAILSIILGMGVPGVASFVIISTIATPLLSSMGVSEMAGSLFCLIYACMSNITPPVAISSYMASTIAESDMTKTSLIAIKLGLHGFLIPFFFIINPLLIGDGKTLPVLISFLLAIIGTFAISISNIGYFKNELNKYVRVLFLLSGILLLYPEFISSAIGLFLLLFLVWRHNEKIKVS